MMRLLISAIAAALILAIAPAPQAEAASISKNQITDILEAQGYAAHDYDQNKIRVDVAGYAILIAIDGTDGDITYITWLNGVSGDDVGLKLLNKFNNDVKFGRAYIDRDGDVTIQMDRNAAGGITAENIESDFDVFLLLISKFLSDLESQTIA